MHVSVGVCVCQLYTVCVNYILVHHISEFGEISLLILYNNIISYSKEILCIVTSYLIISNSTVKINFSSHYYESQNNRHFFLRRIFDFQSIQKLLTSPNFTFWYVRSAKLTKWLNSMLWSILLEALITLHDFFPESFDALHGVGGAYAKRIFVEELGAKESSLLNCVPKVDLEASRYLRFHFLTKLEMLNCPWLCANRKTLEVGILILTWHMQKNWLHGWDWANQVRTRNHLNLVQPLMAMQIVTWSWVKGIFMLEDGDACSNWYKPDLFCLVTSDFSWHHQTLLPSLLLMQWNPFLILLLD